MKSRLLLKHSHLHVILVAVAAASVVLPSASWAANTPARPVPQTIWQGHDLQPIDPNPLPRNRDTTSYDEFTQDPKELDFFISLDIENGFLFMALAHGLQVWDPQALADNPSGTDHIGEIRWPGWPEWCGQFEKQFILTDVAVPAGQDDVAIMSGSCDVGVTIIKTKNKKQLSVAYQDAGFNSSDVYAAVVGGRRLGFAATDFGVRVYDLDAALKLDRCLAHNGAGPCPGVYLGEVLAGTITALTGTEDLVLVVRSLKGMGVYDFSNPTKPALLADIPLSEFNRPAAATGALWRSGASYYAAAGFTVGRSKKAAIYNVSCLSTPTNCTPSLLPWELALGLGDPKMSFSRSGGTPFVYVVSDSRNGGVQNEWLLDVSNPSAPKDLTPPAGTLDGATVGYWGWYYEGNPTGFRWALPRFGEFFGAHFFRAAFSIFDVHRITLDQPPLADFDWASHEPDGLIYGGPTGVGSLVDFIDASQGKVSLRTWTFDQGSPANVTQQTGEPDPTVRFDSPGLHGVSLTASNDVGFDTARHDVEVLAPAPFFSGVGANVAQAPVCGTVRFAAENLTGKQPLSFSWRILDDLGGEITPAPPSPDSEVFEWTSDPGLIPGLYTAELTVTNDFGSDSRQSSPVTVQSLGNLSVQTPTLDALISGSAQFSVTSVGSTQWTWSFGDGSPPVITTDPAEGAQQTHQYTEIGTYFVTVKVENCRDGIITSNALSVVVDKVQPLVANFRANLFCSGGVCQGQPGVPINFQDFSQGAEVYEYDWDGNGTIDQVSNNGPVTSHTYPSSGTFQPILTVSRGGGAETDTFSDHPRIVLGTVQLPQINVSGPSAGETNQPRTFNASCSSAGSTGWSWSVTGGQISGSASGNSVTVTWVTAGLKSVRASHSGCETGSHSIRITKPDDGVVIPDPGGSLPTASFTAPAAGTVDQTLTFNASASTGQITTYSWDFGDGAETVTGSPVTTHAYSSPDVYTVRLAVIAPPDSCTERRGCFDEFTRQVVITGSSTPPPPPPPPDPVEPLTVCPDEDPEAVCLLDDRFKVQVSFDRDGNSGMAQALEQNPLPEQDTTGFLWFFEPSSVDLIVKMIRAQDYFWFFFGGLSDADYTITVTDLETSTTKTYHNDFGNICGSADTQAFPIVVSTGDGQEVVLTGRSFGSAGSITSVSGTTHTAGGGDPGGGDTGGAGDTGGDTGGDQSSGACHPGQDTLCLLDGMYEVTVDWANQRIPDDRGTGRAIQGTNQSGYFWFFDPANVELVVKIIDGTTVNGHVWVFYGGLSDVEYDLTVRNTESQAEKTFHNNGGNICGRADTEAF